MPSFAVVFFRAFTRRCAALVIVLSAVALGFSQSASVDLSQLDVLIRGGRLLDGSGNPWIYADIGVKQGRIAAVGRLAGARAQITIDATGLYVAPGFIDVHSHAAEGLGKPSLRMAEPLLAQGLTTVVLNPDGGGSWPLSEQTAKYEAHGIGVNAALMVGHGTLRREVMGVEDRPPSDEELERMKAMVREGMAAGAFGLSSGLYYAPGSYAATDEVAALAMEVAPLGVYASHIRDEGDYSVGLLAAVDEVIQISEQAGIPGIVTHFKALGPDNWGKVVPALNHIERARERGVSVWTDQYPYEASGTGITGALVPRWALAGETMPGQPTPLERRLRNPRERSRLRDEMLVNIARRGGAETLRISRHRPDISLEGLSLAEIAQARSQAPVDLALDLLDVGGAGLVSFNMSEVDIATIMRKDYNMTSSDGGLVELGEGKPHPRYYGAFARKIRRYVIERQTVTLAQAIRSMSSLPATVFGLHDRGHIRVGGAADIVVFDLAELRDRASYDEPHQLASGMQAVLVNGVPAMLDGTFQGTLSGVVLSPLVQ